MTQFAKVVALWIFVSVTGQVKAAPITLADIPMPKVETFDGVLGATVDMTELYR